MFFSETQAQLTYKIENKRLLSSNQKTQSPLSPITAPLQSAYSSYIEAGDRLKIIFHLTYHLSPPISVNIRCRIRQWSIKGNGKRKLFSQFKRPKLLSSAFKQVVPQPKTICFKAWNCLFPVMKLLVSRCETSSFS